MINPSVVADLGSGSPGVLSRISVYRSDYVEADGNHLCPRALRGHLVADVDRGVEIAARNLAKVRAEKDTEIQLRRINAAFGERQYARSEDLFQRKVVSTNDIDERKTEATLARVQLRQANDNKELAELEWAQAEQVLDRRRIKSPFSGFIMERFKTVGEFVDEQPVVRVAQLDPLHVEVFVPVERLGEIRPGMMADVSLDIAADTEWQAEVTRVDPVADVASGTYGVRLVLPNPDFRIPAGMRCRLTFQPVDVNNMAGLVPRPGIPAIAPDALSETLRVPAIPATPAPVSQALAEVPSDGICLHTVPLPDRAKVEAGAERLRELGLNVILEEQPRQVAAGYRVFSRGYPEFRDAQEVEERLKASGIHDLYIASDLEKDYFLALGYYKTEAKAQQRVQNLANLGIEAYQRPWMRDQTVYRLQLAGPLTLETERAIAQLGIAMQVPGEAIGSCRELAAR